MLRRSNGVRQLHGLHLWLFALAALACLTVARPVFAQGGLVQGVVSDAKGVPIEGATIVLETTDGMTRKFETTTNKKGEYTQIGLPSGAYKVTASKDKLTVTNNLRVRQGAPTKSNFTLAPGVGVSPEAAAKNNEMVKTFDEAVAASKAGNHDEAIAKFTRAAELSPTCADCYNNIGMSEAAKKDYDKAEVAYKKAIEIKADYSDAYSGLANIYNAQRKFDLAAAAGAKAAELAGGAPGAMAGGNPDAMFNQGVILWNAGKIADAKKQFESTIAANPNHAEAHYQLGMALLNEGNLKGAGTEFDTYLKLAPAGPNAAQAKAMAAQLPK
jgi:tetratricopeptide (TPR) repeat protein